MPIVNKLQNLFQPQSPTSPHRISASTPSCSGKSSLHLPARHPSSPRNRVHPPLKTTRLHLATYRLNTDFLNAGMEYIAHLLITPPKPQNFRRLRPPKSHAHLRRHPHRHLSPQRTTRPPLRSCLPVMDLAERLLWRPQKNRQETLEGMHLSLPLILCSY